MISMLEPKDLDQKFIQRRGIGDWMWSMMRKDTEKPRMVNDQNRSWITESTWKIINAKADATRKGNSEMIGKLKKRTEEESEIG
jgi:hypothetical protein